MTSDDFIRQTVMNERPNETKTHIDDIVLIKRVSFAMTTFFFLNIVFIFIFPQFQSSFSDGFGEKSNIKRRRKQRKSEREIERENER